MGITGTACKRSTETSLPSIDLSVGALIVALATLSYLLLWWNRFIGPTLDGQFQVYGQLILQGQIPYRDFYLYVPPLMPLEHAALQGLFGDSLIVPALIGAVERLLIALLCYRIFCRIFSVQISVIAAVLVIILGSTDGIDVLFLYNHHSVLWVLGASLLTDYSREGQTGRWKLEVAAGFCLGLAVLTKHSVGLGATLLLPAVTMFLQWKKGGLSSTWRTLACFGVGWIIPVGSVALWLGWHDALGPAAAQLLGDGPGAKGSLATILIRPLIGWWQVPTLIVPGVVAGLILVIIAPFCIRALRGRSSFLPMRSIELLFLCLASVGAGLVLAVVVGERVGREVLLFPQRSAVPLALWGSSLLFVWLLIIHLRQGFGRRSERLMIHLGSAVAIALTLSMSWPSFALIVLPGLGIVLGLVLEGLGQRQRESGLRRAILLGVILALTLSVWHKLRTPYDFAGWREPAVFQARGNSSHPALRGLRLSVATVEFLERASAEIRRFARPEDSIFVYPHLPILYYLSGRSPATFAIVHWFDVCSDRTAIADARTILRIKPAVLVDFEVSKEEYTGHERFFRGGRRLGQRKLAKAVHKLTGRYHQVLHLQTPSEDRAIRIWVRPDRFQNLSSAGSS